MQFDINWQDRYRIMVKTPRKAMRMVRSGQRLFLGTGCAEPTVLVDTLVSRAHELADVEIVQLFTKGSAIYAQPQYEETFRINSFFIGKNVRSMIQEGYGNYTPMLLSDIPHLFNSGRLPLDVALIQVSPPNENGMVSLGISVDIVRSAIENASLVIAQVNPHMPKTECDSMVNVHDLDILVPVDEPILEREHEPIHPISREIGRRIAPLIPDGSTIEFGFGRIEGFGRIPFAAIEFLKDKKDLGIHSEMITDELLPLIESGAITGAKKSSDKGRIVASFCLGTKQFYDYINNNSLFCFRSTEHVNDYETIRSQSRMVAINPGREIDLTGQVATDSWKGRLYSGIGGHIDFNRGAAASRNGLSIIALPSTDPEGKRSNIVPNLSSGSGVVVTRGDIHYVVTEYGVAYLFGKSIRERVFSLISIAHPDFRKQLFEQAIEARYIRPEMGNWADRLATKSDKGMCTTMVLSDGTRIDLRPVQPTDEPSMRDLFYNLSKETIYYRFKDRHATFSTEQIRDFVYIDHRKEITLIATVPEAHGESIIAVGRYSLNEETNYAEAAFVVRDSWQNKGLGSFMFEHMAKVASANGISGFTASVLRENQRMQTIFNHSGFEVTASLEENGLYNFTISFKAD